MKQSVIAITLAALMPAAMGVSGLWAQEAAVAQPAEYIGPSKPLQAATNRAFQGIPSMAVTPGGRLWATWYAGPTPGEDQNNYVVLSTSADNGRTWTEVLVVDPDEGGPVRAFDPELWLAPDGNLFVIWAQSIGHNGKISGVWSLKISSPEEATPQYGQPERWTDGVMMCKPLVLLTGEWVLPASTWASTDHSAKMAVSTDRGKTWTVRGGCNVPKEVRSADEHMFVERNDGSLWLLARTRYGIGESVSTDRGKTWPELKPSTIPHTAARFFVRRLDSGNLLLVKHGPINQDVGRSQLMAFISTDGGKSWNGGLMLDERKGISYPDGQQTADGLIRIIYDFSRTGARHILMAAFREEDAAAGKDVSGAVNLRQLVSKGSGGREKKATPVRDNADGEALRKQTPGSLHADGFKTKDVSNGANPLKDADYLWQMSDGSNAAGSAGNLKSSGAVQFGVALEQSERVASLARGGDGKVARFEGGYLALSNDAELKINPKHWTVAIRMCDPAGTWRYPILGSYGSDQQVSFALHAVDGSNKPFTERNYTGNEVPTIYSWMFRPGGPRSVAGRPSLLELVWGAQEPNASRIKRIEQKQPERTWPNPLQQDVVNATMKPCFPVGLIGPTDWHDVVICLTGSKLQFWIDGVLVDEEYPIGATRERKLPFLIGAGQLGDQLKTGFKGLVDHVAIWNRSLAPEEIVAVSGGAETVRERELAIIGDESPSMQYFRPRGHNRKAGDLIPYWDGRTNTFRLFYLILRRNMHSKWDGGHGGLEIWQASTKDLTTWQHHPVTIPITEQWEAWNGTGAVAFHNRQYNWFYPTPDYDSRHGGIQRAVSIDGVHFTKTEPHPFLGGGDCEIFQTDDGLFHMVKAGPTLRVNTKPVTDKTLVAWVRLADLDQAGGSVLTIEHPDGAQFDAIVFGERAPRRWMPGSDRLQRTPSKQTQWLEEKAQPNEVIQVALVFQDGCGVLYRNGEVYASYDIADPVTFSSGSSLLIGLRHTHAVRHNGFFRGRVLDARVYEVALSAQQLIALKPDVEGRPQPLAWYDFADGKTRDRTGNFPHGMLFGNTRIENGELVLDRGDYFKVPGTLNTQVRMTSSDVENWAQVEEPFITSDRKLNICPNIFQFGRWHYYICGSGVWRSHGAFGPWTEHEPLRLDNLAVPKTAAFGKNRRIYAGFLPDGGWGGNSVLRELVRDEGGRLGTRFVSELIPSSGEPLPVEASIRLEATDGRQVFELPDIPVDFRLQMEVVPEAGATLCGIDLRAKGDEVGCELIFDAQWKQVRFTKMTDSGGRVGGGPLIDAVGGLDESFKVDIIARHDILDAEIAEFRSMTTRFWNPEGDRIRLFIDGGSVTFRNIRIRPLKDTYGNEDDRQALQYVVQESESGEEKSTQPNGR